jgi:putative transposase
VPFGELAWDHVAGQLAGQGRGDASELERAQAVDELLRRAYHGPPAQDPEAEEGPAGGVTALARSRPRGGARPAARDRRVAARTRATSARDTAGAAESAAGPAAAAPAGKAAACAVPQDAQPVAKVIPLGIFDPFEEARKRW